MFNKKVLGLFFVGLISELYYLLPPLHLQNLTGKIARFATKKLPAWAHRMALSRVISYRPQVSFLPLALDRGASKPTQQRSYVKTKKRLAKKEAAAQKAALALIP